MFIQTEITPNPETLKFLPGQQVMASGTADFTDPAAATVRSPLAARVFSVDGVTAVFLGGDFVSVTKRPEVDWNVLKPMVLGAVMEHFMSGDPVMRPQDPADSADGPDAAEDTEAVAQIRELLETRVRPAVAMDGGDIVFEAFEEGIVYLQMRGACSGCPSSTATLKHGIENMLRHYIPEVREVRAVEAY